MQVKGDRTYYWTLDSAGLNMKHMHTTVCTDNIIIMFSSFAQTDWNKRIFKTILLLALQIVTSQPGSRLHVDTFYVH